MAYSTFGNNGFRCEVCMTYHGQTICRNGGRRQPGSRRARGPAMGACTDLSHGMTELVQCQKQRSESYLEMNAA